MLNGPHMPRVERRLLSKLGRKSGDSATTLRFLETARLVAGGSSSQVSKELARSCVVAIAHRFVQRGVDGLYDGRRNNGAPKVDTRFMRRLPVILANTPDHFGWSRFT